VGDVSLISLFARLLISLAVVLAVMMLAGRAMRRRSFPNGAPRRGRVAPIEVLARQGLGRSASVALVRAGGKVLVLGVTETNVNVLGEADESAVLLEEDGPGADWTALPGDGGLLRPGRSWKAIVDAARDRTVRR
jgi:flagellar protein FliO/FliZ